MGVLESIYNGYLCREHHRMMAIKKTQLKSEAREIWKCIEGSHRESSLGTSDKIGTNIENEFEDFEF